MTTYNADGQATEVQSKDSGSSVLRTTYTAYDDDGNISGSTDGNGNQTTYQYNALNQKTSSTNPLDKSTSYTYDGEGDLLTETEPGGTVVADSHDADGELVGTSYSDGTPSVSYAYNDMGEKVRMADGSGTSYWAYNSLGEETAYTNGQGAELEYGYDLAGDETRITYPDGSEVDQGFNSANEETSLVDLNGNTSTFAYDADGNLTSETLANGVVNSSSYDTDDDLSAISDTSGLTTVFSAVYGRSSDGLITGDSSQPSAGADYQYTGLSQLCYAGSSATTGCSSPPTGATAYSFDEAGNLTDDNGSQQEFNSGDELCWSVSGTSSDGCSTTPSGATSYGYDDNGNLTSVTPASGSAASLTYNGASELTSYQLGSGAATTYAYDGDGLLQSQTTSGSATELSWDDSGSLPLLLQETAGTDTTSYVYGPTGLPLEEVLSSGATYYYSQDNLGSTRVLTDSGGAVADTDSYDPYGNVTASTGSVQNQLLYCGQYMDSESGLYYLQARYYDPVTGQFATVDPLVEETGMPFAYAAGDPINADDPTGLSCSWFGCVVAAVQSAVKTVAGMVGGSHTIGVCEAVSVNVGVGGGFEQGCGVVHFIGPIPVGIATTETLGLGAGPGVGLTGLLGVEASSAPNLKSLGGLFAYFGASGGAGLAGGGSIAGGLTTCGAPFGVGFAGIGMGGGVSGQVGIDDTFEQTWAGW